MRQIRVRTLMVAVAAVALLLGADRLLRRRFTFQRRAERHAKLEAWYRRSSLGWAPGDVPTPEVARSCLESAAFYGRLRSKYERAAARPWLGVEPDTPPPDRDGGRVEEEMEPGWNPVQRSIDLTVRRNLWRDDVRRSDVARELGLSPEVVAREMDAGMFGVLLWERAKPDPIISTR